jgi:hypothetical protein
MSGLEIRASLALAIVFGLRLFGMFVILPVFCLSFFISKLESWV